MSRQPERRRILVEIDPDLMDLVPDYLQNRRQDIKTIQECLKSEEFEKIRKLAHNIKGTGAGYGFPKLSEWGAKIEKLSQIQKGIEIKELIIQMSQYIEALVLTESPYY